MIYTAKRDLYYQENMQYRQVRMVYYRRQSMILGVIASVFSFTVVVQSTPNIFYEILAVPNQIEKPPDLLTGAPEIETYALNETENSGTIDLHANKVIIINFDDSHKSQFTYAKPILDKYGFKATFFQVCN